MKSLFIYCLAFFTTIYILTAQTIIYEKDYPIIPNNIVNSIIWDCNIDNNGNLQVLGYSEIDGRKNVPYNYIRIFDKDLNLLNHLYIDTNSISQHIFFTPKLWRFTTTAEGNYYFYAHKLIFWGFGTFPGFTSKEISKEWQITKDTLIGIRTDTFDIVTALFTADTNMINFGFSNLDSIKHQITIQKANKDNEPIWTKHFDLIDTSFYDINYAYANSFSAKDSNILFFYRPFYKDPNQNPDSATKILYNSCYTRFTKEGELLTHKIINPLIEATNIAVDSDRIYTYYRLDTTIYKFECWDLEMNNIWSKKINFPEYYYIDFNSYPIVNSNREIVITGGVLKDSNCKWRPIVLKYDSIGNRLWDKIIESNDTSRHSAFAHVAYDGKSTYIAINKHYINRNDNGQCTVLKFTEDNADVDSKNNYEKISCSPNPFSQNTRIDFGLEQASQVNIKVMNLKGETVFSTEYFAEAGDQRYDFKSTGLVSGTYYIEINTPNKKYHVKAVLQK